MAGLFIACAIGDDFGRGMGGVRVLLVLPLALRKEILFGSVTFSAPVEAEEPDDAAKPPQI